MDSIAGFEINPVCGHKSPKTLKNDVFPHPFGPLINVFTPSLTLKLILFINISLFGVCTVTSSKLTLLDIFYVV